MTVKTRRRFARVPWLLIGTLVGVVLGWLRERHRLLSIQEPLLCTSAGFITGLIVDFQAQRPGMTVRRLCVTILAILCCLLFFWPVHI
jgi:hypothetical protein